MSILLLVTDDQRWDTLGCTGHAHLETENIDRLAAEGALFSNAFVTTSICCISRASILSGRYARHHRVGDFQTPLSAELLRSSFPALLKQAGYRTGCLGKWGLGGEPPEEWFDEWFAWGDQGDYFQTECGRQVHNSQMLAERAEAFLRDCPPEQPFCLLVNYKSPHEPFLPDPRDGGLFRELTFPIPVTYTNWHFESLPQFIRESEGRARLESRHPSAGAYQEFVRQYLRCLAGVDRSVGRIMSVLDELGRTGGTVVAYTSDNGFLLGEHGLSGKWLMYEESIRVPLILRDPRAPAAQQGRRHGQLALNIDLAPTLLELAGIQPPEAMDGRSLAPLMRGEAVDWRSDFFYEHHYHHAGRIPRSEGVRTADWKYVTYFDVEPAREELYHLAGDPHEEQDLAGQPAFAAQLEALRRRHREYVENFPPPVVP